MKKGISFIWQILKSEGLLFTAKLGFRSVGYLVEKNLLKKKQVIKKINNSYLMELNLQEGGIDKALYLFRTREEPEVEAIKRTIKPGMNILDLGANIGYYTLLLCELVGETGKVFAVEPLPSNFERLKKNIALNKIKAHLEVENIAISGESKEMDFFVGSKHNLGTLVDIGNNPVDQQKIKIKAKSLADFLQGKPQIDLIRMDIERGELAVFKNIIEEWPKKGLKYPQRIMFEVHPEGEIDPDPDFTPLLNKLSDIGYKAKYAIASSHSLAIEKYKNLGYVPLKVNFRGQGLYENIKKEHLIDIAARRRKITRAILLTLSLN